MMFRYKNTGFEPYKNKELFSQDDHSWNNPLPIPCQRQCFDAAAKADAGAVRSSASQNRYLRPEGDKFGESFEEHSKLDRREINSMKGSENIVRLFEEH